VSPPLEPPELEPELEPLDPLLLPEPDPELLPEPELEPDPLPELDPELPPPSSLPAAGPALELEQPTKMPTKPLPSRALRMTTERCMNWPPCVRSVLVKS
jgi:protein TonB